MSEKTNKLPTAEEFLHLKYLERYNNVKEGQIYPVPPTSEAIQYAIEFAKLHVKQALEAAAENVKFDVGNFLQNNDFSEVEIDKQSILNSYNYDNIK